MRTAEHDDPRRPMHTASSCAARRRCLRERAHIRVQVAHVLERLLHGALLALLELGVIYRGELPAERCAAFSGAASTWSLMKVVFCMRYVAFASPAGFCSITTTQVASCVKIVPTISSPCVLRTRDHEVYARGIELGGTEWLT